MRAYQPVSIPALPSTSDPALRQFLSAIKEALEVRLNKRGNALDSSPTFRDLMDTGVLQIKDGVTFIGGRSYTPEQLLGLVEYSLPSWITSDTAPQAPSGLVVSSDKTNTILSWTASTFDQYASTEIWRSSANNLSLAVQVGLTAGGYFTDGLPPAGTNYFYWIRDVARNPLLVGPFNAVGGTSTALGPSAPTVTVSFVGSDAVLTWPTPTSALAVQLYVLEYDNAGWTPLATVAGNAHRFKANWVGARSFRITAYDINGAPSLAGAFSATVNTPVALTVTLVFDGEHVILTWSVPSATLQIMQYEIYDTSVSQSNLLGVLFSTVFRTKVLWASKTFIVRAIDSAGNAGANGVVVLSLALPVVSSLSAQVIDNNVLMAWTSTPGTLPILSFELRRGSTWAGAVLIGKKDGGFTVVFETPQAVTAYTYWLAGIDTAGNYGTPVSVTVTVTQPPDYVLAVNWVSTFSGVKSNARLEGGALTLPINLTETWAQHFTARAWASPAAQISAGYPIYIQPGATPGYYEESFDYGTTLAAMKISVAYLLSTVAGTLTAAVTITVALDAGYTVGVQTFNAALAFAVNFRYVRVRVTVTATNDSGIGRLSNLLVTLDAKLKTQSGAVSANAADSGGTTVYLTDDRTITGIKNFVDVEAITLTALSTTAKYVVYDFTDTPNPLSFKILMFDSAGARATGTVSYTVRGY